MLDANTTILFILRWIHLIAGVAWIGHLYFFNFVNVPYQGKIDADTKKKSNPELLPRALFIFRWSAMFTFLAGWFFLLIKYFVVGSGMTGPSGLMTTPGGLWISFGALFGSVMWFNVWFVIWPAQKQIIPAVKAGTPPPAGLPQRAALFSKINTYLSVPLLFFMGAGSEGHYPVFNYYTLAAATVLGLLIVKGMYSVSTQVKGM